MKYYKYGAISLQESILISIRLWIAEILFRFGYCWAFLVHWAFGNTDEFRKQTKCKYCCRCLTDEEFEKYQEAK